MLCVMHLLLLLHALLGLAFEWHGWYDVEHGYLDRQPDIADSSYILYALLPVAGVILYDEHDTDDSSCIVRVVF